MLNKYCTNVFTHDILFTSNKHTHIGTTDMYKLSPQAQQFIQQSIAAEKMIADMLEETVAKAKADGYDVEMFFDELILTPQKGQELIRYSK